MAGKESDLDKEGGLVIPSSSVTSCCFFFAADEADLTVVHLLDYLTGCIKDTRKVPFADW